MSYFIAAISVIAIWVLAAFVMFNPEVVKHPFRVLGIVLAAGGMYYFGVWVPLFGL